MRIGEVLALQRDHVDLDRMLIHLPRAKTGARDVPVSPRRKEFLEPRLSTVRASGWLFPSAKSKSGHVEEVAKAWRRIVKGADLGGRHLTPHTMRHTAITHLVQAGVNLPTVQRVSGHKTFQMVFRYAQQNQEHVQNALGKLDARISTGGAAQQPVAPVHDYTGITQVARTSARCRSGNPLSRKGGPGWIRTSDQRIMSPLLLPTELQARRTVPRFVRIAPRANGSAAAKV